jgi:hypothetical protein
MCPQPSHLSRRDELSPDNRSEIWCPFLVSPVKSSQGRSMIMHYLAARAQPVPRERVKPGISSRAPRLIMACGVANCAQSETGSGRKSWRVFWRLAHDFAHFAVRRTSNLFRSLTGHRLHLTGELTPCSPKTHRKSPYILTAALI